MDKWLAIMIIGVATAVVLGGVLDSFAKRQCPEVHTK